MTRSVRVMFLSLIAAMLAAVVTLHAKNAELSSTTQQLSPSPRGAEPLGATAPGGNEGRGEGVP